MANEICVGVSAFIINDTRENVETLSKTLLVDEDFAIGRWTTKQVRTPSYHKTIIQEHVFQEILYEAECSLIPLHENRNNLQNHYSICEKWQQRIKDLPLSQFQKSVIWLTLNTDQAFHSERISAHENVDCIVSICSLITSCSLVEHYSMQTKVDFLHDVQKVIVDHGTFAFFFQIFSETRYSSIQRMFINDCKLILQLISPPIVKLETGRRTIRLGTLPDLGRDVLGRSNVVCFQFNNIVILHEIVGRLYHRCHRLPVHIIPLHLSVVESPQSQLHLLESLPEFETVYLVEALLRRSLVLQLQGLPTFLEEVSRMAIINLNLLHEALKELIKLCDSGFICSYTATLQIIFRCLELLWEATVISRSTPPKTKLVRHVVITPTRFLLWPAEIMIENRVLRNFDSEYALRVAFREDNFDKLSNSKPLQQTILDVCIRDPLSNGVQIGNRNYKFLAWSNSQIRDHNVWMYACDKKLETVYTIRQWMGDFSSIHVIPKYMARMGQCFSQTEDTVAIPLDPSHVLTENDVCGGYDPETKSPYVFSDGIGRISKETMEKVTAKMKRKDLPSAIQVRYAGYKGMLTLDPTLIERDIVFRKSMLKFECHSSHRLEVCKASQPGPVRLNRFFITILDQIGVRDSVFLRMQEDTLQDLTEMLLDSKKAANYLSYHNNFSKLDCVNLDNCGVFLPSEPFFKGMLLAAHRNDIARLRSKTQLPVDPSQGRNMFGVLDETGLLGYGQVFVQYTVNILDKRITSETEVLKGKVLVTKNPCYQAGDVRVLQAVNVPALRHIRDCIVFPRNGRRPHPNEMSGSDLDGDEYTVIWKKDLLPEENYPPRDFPVPVPKVMRRNIQMSDAIQFFCLYILNDNLGILSNSHLARSDFEEDGIFSGVCGVLATKCSLAVDFPKHGQVTKVDPEDKCYKFPDFMQKMPRVGVKSYKSKRALGKLYRICRDFQKIKKKGPTLYETVEVDNDFIYVGWKNYEESARKSLECYRYLLLDLLSTYGIQHEGEAMAASFSNLNSRFKSREQLLETEQIIGVLLRSLVKTTRAEFFLDLPDDKVIGEEARMKASAWYMVTYSQEDPKVLSFPWVVSDILAQMKLQQILRSGRSLSPKLSPILSDLTQKLLKFNLPYLPQDITRELGFYSFKNVSRETFHSTAQLIFYWAQSNHILSESGRTTKNPFSKFIRPKDLLTLLACVARDSQADLGVLSLTLEFLRFCMSLRFLSNAERTKKVGFNVNSGFLSKKAMLAYRHIAVNHNLNCFFFKASLEEEEEFEFEPVLLPKEVLDSPETSLIFAQLLKNWSGASQVHVREEKQFYVVSGYGTQTSSYSMESIFTKDPAYLKDAIALGYLPSSS